jgi:cytochrome c oxidase subunit 2
VAGSARSTRFYAERGLKEKRSPASVWTARREGEGTVSNDGRWAAGGALILVSLFGLFVASRAGHGTLYWTGLILFLVAVIAVFGLIRDGFDAAEGKTKERDRLVPIALLAVALGSVAFHILSPWWWPPIASNWQYIDDTIDLTFWITGLVFVAIVVFMAYCAYRFRHREGQRAAYEPESRKLEIILTVVTAVGVAAMLAPGLVVWNRFVDVPDDASKVEVVGQQWQWSFRLPGEDGRLGTTDTRFIGPDNPLGVNPDDPQGRDDVVIDTGALHLPVGQPVQVLLRSKDVLHSFYVPEFRVKMDLVPGLVTRLWLTPTRTGTFQILCAELCGTGHAIMRGTVIVESEPAYQAWLREQQARSLVAASSR